MHDRRLTSTTGGNWANFFPMVLVQVMVWATARRWRGHRATSPVAASASSLVRHQAPGCR